MALLSKLDLEELAPGELWPLLDDQTRRQAAHSLYKGTGADVSGRREADRAVASAIRFREAAVRELPVDRRIQYLLDSVRPDDSLASSLLLSLHLEHRSAMLEVFLDQLGIPQQSGLIDPSHTLRPPDPLRLTRAVRALFERFAEADVELYMASLLAMDPETWGGVRDIIKRR